MNPFFKEIFTILKPLYLFSVKNNKHENFTLVYLFDWALEPNPVMGRLLLQGTASSPRVGVFVTPLLHLKAL